VKKVVTRAGISPLSGKMRIGGLRTHLYNYALARHASLHGGKGIFFLRCDDTNKHIHSPELFRKIYTFFTNILGIHVDFHPYNSEALLGYSLFQSARTPLYALYVERLLDEGLAYQLSTSKACYFAVQEYSARFGAQLIFDDAILGTRVIDLQKGENPGAEESRGKKDSRDFPLTRTDGTYLFHLCSPVDDSLMGITHVLRGVDKLSAVANQEMVRVALQLPEKIYAHVPIWLDQTGHRLKGSTYFDDFIQQGFLPQSLISYICSSAYGDPDRVYKSLDEFAQIFELRHVHAHNGRFDFRKLQSIDKQLLKLISADAYIKCVLTYCKQRGEEDLAQTLSKDIALQGIILDLRRSIQQSFDILKEFLKPGYHDLPPAALDRVPLLLPVLRSSFEDEGTLSIDAIRQVLNAISPQQFYSSFRWVLSGNVSGIDIQIFLNYLIEKGLLSSRMDQAQAAYNRLSSQKQ
jgi:glutamyl/glutaminyl-tRNA synthetase